MHATFRGHFFDDVRAREAECGRAWESKQSANNPLGGLELEPRHPFPAVYFVHGRRVHYDQIRVDGHGR